MRLLLELRPALEGHSGIPQEARLLFAGLSALEGVEVEGLIQSGNLRIAPGLPLDAAGRPRALPADERYQRLSRVIISLQQHRQMRRVVRWAHRAAYLAAAGRWAWRSLGRSPMALEGFDPTGFEDWLWRTLFDKTLPESERLRVTSLRHRLLRTPWSLAHGVGVVLSRAGAGAGYPVLDAAGADVVIAETPFPARFAPPTKLLVRYHDAVPVFLPHTIKNMALHRDMHHLALRRNVRDGAWFACVSESTRRDLLVLAPEVEARAVTVPNMVSHHYGPDERPRSLIPEIVWARKNRDAPHQGGAASMPVGNDGAAPYLLMVATVEPRKNHATLLEAWQRLRQQGNQDLQLVLVGSLGWSFDGITSLFEPWLERGALHLLHRVPATDLRLLYRHAAATICPSVSEGFDFPGVEAMRSGGVVVASDIPVHRDIFSDACLYFDAYSEEALAAVLESLVSPAAGPQRDALRARGLEIAESFTPQQVLPQWQQLLKQVVSAPAPALKRR
jgi:glycosyltransferase involved in cell wall biosynthesis